MPRKWVTRLQAWWSNPSRARLAPSSLRMTTGRGCVKYVTAYEVLLIADEVQTGFGRTGKIFGVDHWNVTPDIMCFGKALGGGVIAMSGFFSTAKIWKCMEPNPFMHTTTTGGNPVACAAALAHITVMLEEDLPGQAAEKGEYILEKSFRAAAKIPRYPQRDQGPGPACSAWNFQTTRSASKSPQVCSAAGS